VACFFENRLNVHHGQAGEEQISEPTMTFEPAYDGPDALFVIQGDVSRVSAAGMEPRITGFYFELDECEELYRKLQLHLRDNRRRV
jgi:hypothetical protein